MNNGNLLAAFVLLAVLAGGFYFGFFGSFGLGAVADAGKFYRPVWGSVGCEFTGSGAGTAQDSIKIANGNAQYFCKGGSCRVASMSAACGGVPVYEGGSANYAQGFWAKVCVDNNPAKCATGNQIYNLKAAQGETLYISNVHCYSGLIPPLANGTAGIEYSPLQLMRFQDGSRFNVQGGAGCLTADAKYNFGSIQPVASDAPKTDFWKQVGTALFGVNIQGYMGGETAKTFKNTTGAEFLKLGTYLPYIVEWREIIAGLHIYKPIVGKFAGKNILCDTAQTRIYEFGSVRTSGGAAYNIPIKDLGAVACCNDADCALGKICNTAGGNFVCEQAASTCQKACATDLVCGGTYSHKNGAPVWTKGECVNSCCKYTDLPVECVEANDCPARDGYTKECDSRTHECLYSKNADYKTACAGECCSGSGNYYAKACATGLCCPAGADVGVCKASCSELPSSCGDGICQLGEQLTCPPDCQPKTECPAGQVLVEKHWLGLDFMPAVTDIFGNAQKECRAPADNGLLIVGGVVLLAGAIVFAALLMKRKR
ncbi:MAG: hypothetical protein V1676_03825 [Candidatus Diapherotrites archaeon]